MHNLFICKNGQHISWRSVCDGYNQCIDNSDEENCHCQGDIYACLQGNNVSCRLACATYGRVTCLTYQNRRACEQYNQEFSNIHSELDSTGESSVFMNDFDALQYSVGLAIGVLLFFSIISILIYIIRKKPSRFLFKSSISQQQVNSCYTPAPGIYHSPPSYHYSDQTTMPINDSYEPPPYPGLPLFPSLYRSDSIYYETIKTPSISNSMSMLNPMPLPELHDFSNIRTHCV